MARRTVHIPDDLDDRVEAYGGLGDSYSGIVQDALREYLSSRDEPAEPTQN
jgi:Arc/MetJ-type ribon-helix-helix transcriptional regulator